MLTFTTSTELQTGKLVYLSADLSLETIGRKTAGVSSLLINDINIDLSIELESVAVWGLCPSPTWQKATLTKPKSKVGKLWFTGHLEPGVSIRITPAGRHWPVTFDASSGWLKIGDTVGTGDEAIEFIEGCVVILRQTKVIGLVLQPDIR